MLNEPVRLLVQAGDVVPSSGIDVGMVSLGSMPVGEYREIDPIGGRAGRLENDTMLFVPMSQSDYDESGKWFHVSRFVIKEFLQSKTKGW